MKVQQIDSKITQSVLELDYYVPITIDFPENNSETAELFYYEFINNNDSLVEIKINSKSKKIFSIILVNVNQKVENKKKDFKTTLYGNMIIDIGTFENSKLVHERTNYSICSNNDKKELFFIIEEKRIMEVIEISNFIKIFLDSEKNIMGMNFLGFNENEWEHIKKSLKLEEYK